MSADDHKELWLDMFVLASITVVVIVTLSMRKSPSQYQERKEYLTIAPYVHHKHAVQYHPPKHQYQHAFLHQPYRYHHPYPHHRKYAPV